MRLFFLSTLFFLCIYSVSYGEGESFQRNQKVRAILEFSGDTEQYETHIKTYYPSVDIIATYSLLFQGVAVKANEKELQQLEKESFVEGVYPTQAYVVREQWKKRSQDKNIPAEKQPYFINQTRFTGKGVKVGVIDTGISLAHPDLQKNYRGGYDLVDLDDKPEETLAEEGMETSHGTHVAGIIAADGTLKGVAPDAAIYAYRALGPGGIGSSIQVIAALEEAVKDGVDIINLSLGNIVNAPDYPTSKAVNEAVKRGVIVVVANGNTGPNAWTVGSPATAKAALSVGAYEQAKKVPILVEPKSKKKIALTVLPFSPEWEDMRDREIVSINYEGTIAGKIVLLKLNEKTSEEVERMQKSGIVAILIYLEDSTDDTALYHLRDINLTVPIALVSKDDAMWLNEHVVEKQLYVKNERETVSEMVAPFSSRGPVTVDWLLKPDIIAPGVQIVSTVPGGYESFNGTSMAAPHVAGALAVLKEARPTWANEQLIGAMKTTAKRIELDGDVLPPTEQGSGLIDIAQAIETETIIYNPNISFGRFTEKRSEKKVQITIQNVSTKKKTYRFSIPKHKRGLTWRLPSTVTLAPKESRTLTIALTVNPHQLESGLYEDWLHIQEGDNDFYVPYIFIVETADFAKVSGFSFHVKAFNDDAYAYEMYVTENAKQIEIELYDPVTLLSQGTLFEWTDVHVGLHEGEIKKRNVKQRGYYYGIIKIELENGDVVYETTEVMLE